MRRFSGYRILKLKDLVRGGNAQAIDWAAAVNHVLCSSACLAAVWVACRPHLGAEYGDRGDRVRVPGDAVGGDRRLKKLYLETQAEDVLVVHAFGELYRELHRGVDSFPA